VSVKTPNVSAQERMAEAVRLVISGRERAPRSPRMDRAFKRLIWRYSRALQDERQESAKEEGRRQRSGSHKSGGHDE
jgi:hypothetical protein